MPQQDVDPRTVYLANISYEATKSDVIALFEQYYPVESFDLIRDSYGKPRGFGFMVFRNLSDARAAVRELNGRIEINGRPVRVQQHGGGGKASSRRDRSRSPEKPVPVSGTHKQVDAVQQVMQEMSDADKAEVLTRAQQLVKQDPNAARTLLRRNPALAQALLMALSDLQILQQGQTSPLLVRHAGATPPPPPVPIQPVQQQPPVPPPVRPAPPMPAPAPPAVPMTPATVPIAGLTLEEYNMLPPLVQQKVSQLNAQQQAIFVRVCRMTAETVRNMPEAQQNQIVTLRKTFGLPAL
ncbi:MAG: hypothetical protein MHM6MM_003338 [Cercozoa sp. M6MM]